MELQIEDKLVKVIKFTEGNICDRCLGRNFSKSVAGSGNLERGEYLRNKLEASNQNIPKTGSCYICNDLFESLDKMTNNVVEVLKDKQIHFSNFLVGSRVDSEILKREEQIHKTFDIDVENIKKEINREIGKELSLRLSKEVEFDNPNVVLMVDFKTGKVDIQINPIFIESRYRKLIRGIPQTKWPCNKCKGKGCEKCNYTGKMYAETVEELISEDAIKAAKGASAKFHGAGREDIDVKMLGKGRTFVLEIKEPKIRDIDLKKLVETVNKHAMGKVEISEMKFVAKNRRAVIKESSRDTYKIYKATVELENEVDNSLLDSLKSMKIINQRTPIRVSHRRADKIRTREIRQLEYTKVDSKLLELVIECEGGLYIKELISSDENRSQPSVAGMLKTGARCVQLDVLDVNI
ncbi:tRNA pseudouridine(54/55) synthase Pus10 [Methanobacterium spitsbergense]|uniref:tRNA pseudouridine synthase Pus10 n=1 Tax=Methanobacterium spitsbergense TaxID=2874285 RepID=A0A8T5UM79_9EURY|nr:tRNA pseudouridine(54/55) synthase Pus10 [Methanobacterium spitsbergense]MBZ2164968.1 tRNA pseudouridine(54/55) synthase Pus10 [Methanobacterium spitsbergense]